MKVSNYCNRKSTSRLFVGLFTTVVSLCVGISQAYAQVAIEVRFLPETQTPVAGEVTRFTYRIENLGPDTAENLQLTNSLPAGVSFVEDNNFCTATDPQNFTCRPSGSAFTAPPFQLGAGQTATVDVWVKIDSDVIGQVTDLASVSVDNGSFSVTSFGDDIEVQSVADLSVRLFASEQTVYAGQQFDFLIFLDNLGPSDAWEPVVDLSGFTQSISQFVNPNGCSISVRSCSGFVDEFDCNFAMTTGIFNLGTFGAQSLSPYGYRDCAGRDPSDPDYDPEVVGRTIITMNMQATQNGQLTGIAHAYSEGDISFDPNSANNSSTAITYFSAASDLEVSAQITSAPVEPWIRGDAEVTYEYTISTDGPSLAENVILENFLPEGVSVVSASVTAGTGSCVPAVVEGAPLVCNLGLLDDTANEGPASKTVEVIVRVDSDFPVDSSCTGILSSTVAVTSEAYDLDNTNNVDAVYSDVACDPELGAGADLGLTSAVTNAPAEPWSVGDEVVYTLTVENFGPEVASNVTLADSLPAGVTILGTSISGGTGSCAVGTPGDAANPTTCNFGTLDDDGVEGPVSKSVEVTVRIDSDFDFDSGTCSGQLTNSARVMSSGVDPDNSNNLAGSSSEVACNPELGTGADLSVSLAPSLSSAGPAQNGNEVVYTLTVENLGAEVAQNVVLNSAFPVGVTVVGTEILGGDGVCLPGIPGNVDAPTVCNLGTLDDDGVEGPSSKSVQLTVSIAPNFNVDANTCTGTLMNSAYVTSDTNDANNANDFVSFSTVTDSPACAQANLNALATADLSLKLNSLQSEVQKFKAPSSQKKKARRKQKKALRSAGNLVVETVATVELSASNLLIVANSPSTDDLSKGVKRSVKKLLRAKDGDFKKKKRAAKRSVKRFQSSILG